jgi:hypothetical protein
MSSFEEAARSGGAEQRRAANKPSSAGLRATILSVYANRCGELRAERFAASIASIFCRCRTI